MRLLLDAMWPPAAAQHLRDELAHDAVHVSEVGLRAVADSEVATTARSEQRALVTENVADFAVERDLVVVCVLKRNLPDGTAQAPALASLLHRWARANPTPYLGQHWPK